METDTKIHRGSFLLANSVSFNISELQIKLQQFYCKQLTFRRNSWQVTDRVGFPQL